MPLSRWDGRTVRIDLPAAGEWVEVKSKLGKDDERAIKRRMMSAVRAEADGTVGGMDVGVAYDVAEFATLEQAIVTWSFPDAVTPENLRAIDDASLDVIKARLDEMYEPELTPEQVKNSGGDGQPTPAESPSPSVNSTATA